LYRPAEGARRSPYALAEWGRKIADDDSRPGVGLRADGLPDIVWGEPVVAGTYKIGGDEKARKSLPEQDVTFDYSYRLAIYPITVKQFEIFLKVQDGIALDRWWSSLSFGWGDKQVGEQTEKSANHPRTDVNWYQAVAFCRWLTVQYRDANLLDADSEIRLPTGQEWEVVARYPDGRAYPWGNDYRVGSANCDEQERGDGPYLLNRSVAVGLYEKGKQPHLGIYDLSGTVWEWCLNESSKPERTATEGTALRVLRGGSWRSLTSLARAASRLAYDPLGRSSFIGFRVVLAPVQSLSSESSGL
ncbi:MAG: SUMF1/EgtB/PvdO family nonheme iron enzyme, partial [Chloroflexota bacterium]